MPIAKYCSRRVSAPTSSLPIGSRPNRFKACIVDCANRKPALEGVVFVGDVPIAKVGGAQHMTTAFKMNEDRFPRQDSWVATDRFYDDFDLKFDFVERDSIEQNIFYYRLSEQGIQHLEPDIYSARMVVPAMFDDPYGRYGTTISKRCRCRTP